MNKSIQMTYNSYADQATILNCLGDIKALLREDYLNYPDLITFVFNCTTDAYISTGFSQRCCFGYLPLH